MERRLLKAIMTPAMVASFIFGIWLVGLNHELIFEMWFQIKFGLVLGMAGCHGKFSKMQRLLEDDVQKFSARTYRIWNEIPTVSKRIGTNLGNFEKAEYMIWRDPWMTAGSQTFIGSVLKKIGFSEYLQSSDSKYPTLNSLRIPDPSTFYLFSSEPFPFERCIDELEDLGFNGALVDGEFFSWFGSRSYRMLSDLMKKAL